MDAFWCYMLSMSIDFFFFFLLVWLFFFFCFFCYLYLFCCCFFLFLLLLLLFIFLHFVSMVLLIYGLIFCFPTCFFVFFSFGCSTGVVGKGDGAMYGGN